MLGVALVEVLGRQSEGSTDVKVCDTYDVDEDVLGEKAEESDYWEKSRVFWYQVKDSQIADLSVAQVDWLHRIEQALDQGVSQR